MRFDHRAVAARQGQDEHHVDAPMAIGAGRFDEGSTFRVELADDLLQAPDPGLDLDQDRVPRPVEAEVDRAPARPRHISLDRWPPDWVA